MLTYYSGEKVCQLCDSDLREAELVDGKTNRGPWATMCISCHAWQGLGLGLGVGQRYLPTQTNGKIRHLKVEG